MMAISTLRLDDLLTDGYQQSPKTDAKERGYLQVVYLMVQRTKEQARISANKYRNRMAEHLFICLTLGDPKTGNRHLD